MVKKYFEVNSPLLISHINNKKDRTNLEKIISLQNNYIKSQTTPAGYDRILDEKLERYNYYKALTNDEIKYIKNNYLNFYNTKLQKRKERYGLIKDKKKKKDILKKEIFNKRGERVLELTSKLKNVTGNKLDVFDKGFYTWSKYYNLLNQSNITTYTYYYEKGEKKYKFYN